MNLPAKMFDDTSGSTLLYCPGKTTANQKSSKCVWKNNTLPLKQIKAELVNNIQVLLDVDISVKSNTNINHFCI